LPDGEELANLATRVQRGDPSAEEFLVDLFYERVRLVALFRTGNAEAARELAQDVLMAVVTALRNGGVRDAARLTAFVYGTARNHVNSYFRTGTRRPEEDALTLDYPAAPAPDPVESAERTARVREALATLQSSDRKILLLTLVDGLKPGEIARRLGLSDEVVRARKSRAIKKVALLMHKVSRI
jgi:RNA polymerase sigma factor (sigma-70 family)